MQADANVNKRNQSTAIPQDMRLLKTGGTSDTMNAKQKLSSLRQSSQGPRTPRKKNNVLSLDPQAIHDSEITAILTDSKHRYKIENKKALKKAGQLATLENMGGAGLLGNEKYQVMPSRNKMLQSFNQTEEVKKQRLLNELSKNQVVLEGILTVNETKHKKAFKLQPSPVNQYVENFSTKADVLGIETNADPNTNVALNFAGMLQDKM